MGNRAKVEVIGKMSRGSEECREKREEGNVDKIEEMPRQERKYRGDGTQ
jgi:hypothetical protein